MAELVAMTTSVPVGERERKKQNQLCSRLTLQISPALVRFESLQHIISLSLGRDKFISGLLITHQSLGGLLCEYLSV